MAYIIKSGDTLSGIAAANKTTVAALMSANPSIKDPNKIYAGASLNLISAAPAPAPAPAPTPAPMPTPTPAPTPKPTPQPTPQYTPAPQTTQQPTYTPAPAPAPAPASNSLITTNPAEAAKYAGQQLNTDTSIVDYLKSVGADSSWSSRVAIAAKMGISNYTGTAEQNISMLKAVKGQGTGGSTPTPTPTPAPTPTPTPTPTPQNPALAPLTEGQNLAVDTSTVRGKSAQEIADQAKAELATSNAQDSEINTLTKQKTIQQLKQELGIDTGAPVAPNLVTDYEALRSKEGVGALETQVQSIDAQIREAQAALTAGVHKISGELAPMELLTGKQAELRNQATDLLNTLNARKATLVEELTTKNNVISNIMNLKSVDYANAKEVYNTKFSQTIQLQDLLMSDEDRKNAQKNLAADNARANLTVMSNVMGESGLALDAMPDDFKVGFAKEAMKAGISPESITAVMTAKPGLKIDAMIQGTNENGNEIVSFFSYNNGNPKLVQTVETGGKAAGKATEQWSDPFMLAGDLVQREATTGMIRTAVNVSEKETGLTDEQKILKKFTDTLTSWNKEGTREQFIRVLQAQNPDIDPSDIARKVYEVYPDGYDS